jgi:hypothetical protein
MPLGNTFGNIRNVTIWLISEPDPVERRRRCFGFIENERGWQDKFDKIEAETLAVRTDQLVAAGRRRFQEHRQRFEKRLARHRLSCMWSVLR